MGVQQAVIVTKKALNWDTVSEVVKVTYSHPKPVPQKGQSLVRMFLRPVNPSDLGKLFTRPEDGGVFPHVIGNEGGRTSNPLERS
jgi:hypothetical protein